MNKMALIGSVSALIGGVLLLMPKGVMPSPVPAGDVLSECYKADRASKVSLLRSMADQEFPNDAAKAKAWNDGVDAARSADFKPFVDQELAQAFADGKLKELADRLEAVK